MPRDERNDPHGDPMREPDDPVERAGDPSDPVSGLIGTGAADDATPDEDGRDGGGSSTGRAIPEPDPDRGTDPDRDADR